MKRGRKPGQIVNPRDERGWMIPREGTVRRRVYDALCAGSNQIDGMTQRAFSTHKANIVNWPKVREWRTAWMRDDLDSAKAGAV